MKKISFVICSLFLFSCSNKMYQKEESENQLYQVLKVSEYGGAAFKFYEIVSQPEEFKMLLNDSELKDKIRPSDINHANFLLLNMGEKNTGGYTTEIISAEETEDSIIIRIKENSPQGVATMVISYPLTIIKVNSKKPVVFQ